jgi:adenylate cyclase
MPQEIEHKYLVRLDVWQPTEQGVLYRQGYLSTVEERVVRVRIAGERAYLTIKGAAHDITRLEFEYAIPVADAATMLDLLCERPLIEKTRYRQSFGGKTWEIDVFHGDNAGLVVAEVRSRVNPTLSSRLPGSGVKCPMTRVILIPTLSTAHTKTGARPPIEFTPRIARAASLIIRKWH